MANEEHLKILKQGVEVWNRWRVRNPLIQPDLNGANLSGAKLDSVDLSYAMLINATLSNADLNRADLSRAILFGADFTLANLSRVNFRGSTLDQANLKDSRVTATMFADVDLSGVEGLESLRHRGPSTIGIDTIHCSKGKIPEAFLRGCGVPEPFITYITSLTSEDIRYYSCFISYSSKDDSFAQRLHADLQDNAVRCWFAPVDMKIGDEIRPRIDQSIRMQDKLLVVLSEHSIESDWVEDEVETAIEEESKRKETVLFPIRLDEAVMDTNEAWAAKIRRTRHIGDFSRWKEHDSYQQAFDRLLRDLKEVM